VSGRGRVGPMCHVGWGGWDPHVRWAGRWWGTHMSGSVRPTCQVVGAGGGTHVLGGVGQDPHVMLGGVGRWDPHVMRWVGLILLLMARCLIVPENLLACS
jgi:hypothetical protein